MSFETSINRILGLEGGLVDNPNDPGGLTQWGISQRSYPNLDIRALTREQAIALFKRDFWEVIQGDSFPDSVGYQLLDFAVNSSVGTAIRALQTSVGVASDGHVGPITQAAIKAAELHDLIMRFLAWRIDFMTRCSDWPNAGRGWALRISKDLMYGAADA